MVEGFDRVLARTSRPKVPKFGVLTLWSDPLQKHPKRPPAPSQEGEPPARPRTESLELLTKSAQSHPRIVRRNTPAATFHPVCGTWIVRTHADGNHHQA